VRPKVVSNFPGDFNFDKWDAAPKLQSAGLRAE
jgi:hypothetical protein